MTDIFNYLVESGISLGLFTLLFLLALRQEKAFVFNRYYLLASVIISAILPFIHFSIESIPNNFIAATLTLAPVELNQEFIKGDTSLFSLLIWSYGITTFCLLLRLILKIQSVKYRKGKTTIHEGYTLVELTNSTEAFTLFNTIYLGDQLPPEERSLILSHEKVHAREKHSIDLLIVEVCSALLWINPLLIVIKKLVRTNHEFLADAHAISVNGKDHYVQLLASHALENHGFTMAHSFHSSVTLKRIRMINKQKHKIMRIKQVLPFGLAIALFIAFGCDENSQSISDIGEIKAVQDISGYPISDGAYEKVEEMPSPIGGMTEFYTWVAQNLKYPIQARKKGIEGKVYIQFVLDEAGNLTQVKAIKGIGGGCDNAAVELIKKAAPWNPGKIDGKTVPVRMILPVSFKVK